MRPRAGRLVRPQACTSRAAAVQLPRQDLRPSLAVRVQRHLPSLAGGELGSRGTDRLYAKTGAKYFVALANHHDNFDCWDSKYQPWNCVNVGPKKDIVGTWGKAARAHGLQVRHHRSMARPGAFGGSSCPSATAATQTGPLKGVPYDGVLTKADGKGKWWEGMDPQQLNGRPHGKDEPCPEFVEKFMLRVQDVIDKYNPDLLYFDDNCDWDSTGERRQELNVWLGMPELAPHIMAYYYNANIRRNGGKLDAVFNIKNVPRAVLSTLVRDFEMSQAGAMEPNPWQTDACIGGWHYSRSIFENHRYRTARVHDSSSGRCRQQERQSAAEYTAARPWQARRRRNGVPRQVRRLDGGSTARRFTPPGPGRSLGRVRRKAPAVRCMAAAARNLSPATSGLRLRGTRCTR